jgi:hypothetical protein
MRIEKRLFTNGRLIIRIENDSSNKTNDDFCIYALRWLEIKILYFVPHII